MLTDPQTVTINTVEKTLNRISSTGTQSTYSKDDETVKLIVSHQESKGRTRHMIRLDETVVAADPLTAVNASKKLGAYLVIDEPDFGFTDAEIDYVVQALVGWMTSANVLKVLSLQH